MTRIRIVDGPDGYLAALRAPAILPAIGRDRLPALRRLAAAYGSAVVIEEGDPAPPAAAHELASGREAARRGYLAALAGRAPDHRHLVVGLEGAWPAAACHAALRGARLELIAELSELGRLVHTASPHGRPPQHREPPASVALVGLADRFGPSSIRYLHTELTGAGVPWGMLTGATLGSVAWLVLKQWLPRGAGRWPHLLLFPMDDPQGAPRSPGSPAIALHGAEITAAVLRGLTTAPHDLVTITAHGDQADAYARAGWLCGRPGQGTEEILAATRGAGLMRCFAERHCYRSVATAQHDGVPAQDKVLVPGGEVLATVLLLNTCASLAIAPGYRYRPESSLLNACIEGITVTMVALELPRPADPAEALLFSGLLRTGSTVGQAVLALNRAQRDYFAGVPAFTLVGDPALRISDPAAAPPGGQVTRVALPAGPAVGNLRAEPAGDQPGVRAFMIQGESGPEVLMTAEGSPLDESSAARLVVAAGLGVAVPRVLQRRLRELEMIACPPDEGGTARLREKIARLLMALHRPSGGGRKSERERQALGAVSRELLLFQSKAVLGWTAQWAGALTGDMISLREERVLYDPFVPSTAPCPVCAAPLYEVTARDLYLPDAIRTQWMCPSCTVVADLPGGAGLLPVSVPASVARGRSCDVVIDLTASAGTPGVTVAGAAILGARGRCRPALLPMPGRPAGPVRLTLAVGADMVPGSYSLRVVVMEDLAVRFHLRPISVLTRGESEPDGLI